MEEIKQFFLDETLRVWRYIDLILYLLICIYSNGRLAMLAISGIYAQDVLFGNYGDMIFKSS